MKANDINDLLENYFSDGFSIESLSQATNLSVDLISRCYNGDNLLQKEISDLNYLLFFLSQLYLCDVSEPTYLQSMAYSFSNYFGFSLISIANYLNISEDELMVFLKEPDSYSGGYSLSIKMLHLFTTFIRDKKHSE
jgi:hypothetical protein